MVSKGNSPAFRNSLLNLLVRMKSSGNNEKKVAVAKIIPRVAEAFKTFDDAFKGVLDLCKDCIDDENLETRNTIAERLIRVIKVAKPTHEKQLRALITLCLEKGPDFIRAQTIPCILALTEIDKGSATALLKTAASLPDWRVRYAVCQNIDKIGELFGPPVFASFLTKNYADYLLDQNPDTRVASIECMPIVCKYIEQDTIILHIIPCLSHVASDAEVSVRVALAQKLPILIPKLGKRRFNEHFLPLVLALLRDESMDVKSVFLDHFAPIFEVISPTTMIEALEPVLNDMAKAILWRNKKIALEFIVKIATVSGKEGMKESLIKIVADLMKDNFESVRDVVCQTIIRFKEILGEEWIVQVMMPELEKIEKHQHFKYRVAYMKYVSKLWLIFSQDLSRKMLQSIISGMSDSVPNVRINAAKAGLSAIVNPKCSYASIKEMIKAGLQKQTADSDGGVATNAKECIKAMALGVALPL